MTINQNLLMSSTNVVQQSDITANIEPVNSILFLAQDSRSRQTRWVNPDGDVVVTFALAEPSTVQYLSIAGHDLPDDGRVKFTANTADNDGVIDTGWITIGDLLPLGVVTSTDKWNTAAGALKNNVFYVLDEPEFNITEIVLTVEHNYTYAAPVVTETEDEYAEVSNGIYQQNSAGVISVEAEDCEITGAGSDTWNVVADAEASGGSTLLKATSNYYWSARTGPGAKFQFKADRTGSHAVWFRMKSNAQGNSIYAVLDNNVNLFIERDYTGFADNTWQWRRVATVTLVANNNHKFEVKARDRKMYVDKVVIQPVNSPNPSGTGPAASSLGVNYVQTTGGVTNIVQQDDKKFVSLRSVMAGEIIQMSEAISAGMTTSWITPPTRIETESGYTVQTKTQQNVKNISMDLAVMSNTDRRLIVTHQADHNNKSFMVSVFPDQSGWIGYNYTFLGSYGNSLSISHDVQLTYSSIHSTTLQILET